MRLAIALAALVVASPAMAQRACMVTDPTGTPLNVRGLPNGPIVGVLQNGTLVRQVKTSMDDRGKPWTFVTSVDEGVGGWVFREFVSCY